MELKERADVISAEREHIGDFERVFTDLDSARATFILVSRGLLLKEKKLVPIKWVTTIQEDQVHLSVNGKQVDRLPDYGG